MGTEVRVSVEKPKNITVVLRVTKTAEEWKEFAALIRSQPEMENSLAFLRQPLLRCIDSEIFGRR